MSIQCKILLQFNHLTDEHCKFFMSRANWKVRKKQLLERHDWDINGGGGGDRGFFLSSKGNRGFYR